MLLAPSVSGLFKWRQFEPEVILLVLTTLSGFVFGSRLPGHRDETDRQHGLLLDLRPMLSQQVKLLIARSTDRDDHPATVLQLIGKRLWDMVRGTGHNDGVERRMLRPALVPITGKPFTLRYPSRLRSASARLARGSIISIV